MNLGARLYSYRGGSRNWPALGGTSGDRRRAPQEFPPARPRERQARLGRTCLCLLVNTVFFARSPRNREFVYCESLLSTDAAFHHFLLRFLLTGCRKTEYGNPFFCIELQLVFEYRSVRSCSGEINSLVVRGADDAPVAAARVEFCQFVVLPPRVTLRIGTSCTIA